MTTRYLAIGLASLTLIGLELIWTRIFSAEIFYTFAFLILSLAILGLGMGALTLRLIPKVDNREFLGIILSLGGLAAIIGPPAVIHFGLSFSQLAGSPAMLGKLVLTIILLALPYYFGGMALAMMFKQNSDKMPKLYLADLLGAGSGVLMAIIFMNQLGTPTAVFWAVLPVLIGSLIVSRRWLKIIPVFLLVVMAVTGARSRQLVEPQREERAPVIYRHWDAMGLVRQYDYGNGYRGLEIDRAANSPVWAFDGNWERLDSMPLQFGIDMATLIYLSAYVLISRRGVCT